MSYTGYQAPSSSTGYRKIVRDLGTGLYLRSYSPILGGTIYLVRNRIIREEPKYLGTIETPSGRRLPVTVQQFFCDDTWKTLTRNKEPPHYDIVSVYRIGDREWSITYKERKEAYTDNIFSVEEMIKNHRIGLEKRRKII